MIKDLEITNLEHIIDSIEWLYDGDDFAILED
ncbi:hypothetical protein M472_04870 [Sphingobacterium paucimobilis HER1398]|uniref:Uncharacterized protein n=1 Tax=Sphingobacterium paucimobilis HER1398 TaxID=1346330 RepID=U2HRJ6_9SPHI|nr:hypothetical protein M472_04870 [Sphingobacterium paucimobilis HER1398]